MLQISWMSVEQPQPEDQQNSEIDFREFFSPNQDVLPAPEHPPFGACLQREKRGISRVIPRLSWAAAANIIFAAIALTGGLFCSFHFFNSAEPSRVISVFPLKFAYQRPFTLERDPTIDKSDSISIHPRTERAVGNWDPQRESVRSASVPPQFESAPPEKRSALIPAANLTPNLSSPRFSQAPGSATSSTVGNRASASSISTKTSEAKNTAKLNQTKHARALRNNGVGKKVSDRHTQVASAKSNRSPYSHRHSTQFDRARQTMDRLKPTHDFSARALGAPSGLSLNPGSSFRPSANLSRGSR
jgi:hypothetical protein